jgi:hypothetical protein
VFFALVLCGLLGFDAAGVAAFGAGPAAALLASALLAWRSPRSARVEIAPGHVRLGDGPLATRIVPADVQGASTARRSDGVSLALGLRSQPGSPIELRFTTEEEARAVLGALGIGHRGTGTLTWHLVPGWLGLADRVLRLGAGLSWLAVALGLFFATLGVETAELLLGLATLAAVATTLALVVTTVARSTASTVIVLDPHGVGVGQAGLSYARLRWDEVESASASPRGLHLATRRGPMQIALPALVAEPTVRHVTAQILSAAKRARGLGPDAPDHASVADLARGEQEPVRAWLARLDGLLGQGFGYRGRPIGVADLWSLLEDPDAPADARAAAARLLARIAPDELRVRIAPVLSAIADEERRRRIYVACHVEETERAAAELEALEREETERRARSAGVWAVHS